MANIHWANAVDGNFNDSGDWSPSQVPGPGDTAILDASGGAYTVLAQHGLLEPNQTVEGIQTAANATLLVQGGLELLGLLPANTVFSATGGTGGGSNAGIIEVENNLFRDPLAGLIATRATVKIGLNFGTTTTFNNSGEIFLNGQDHLLGVLDRDGRAVLAVRGRVEFTGGGQILMSDSAKNRVHGNILDNVDNTISGAGSLGVLTEDGPNLNKVINETGGVIDASASLHPLIIHTVGQVANAGTIEATGTAGGKILDTVYNTGTLKAAGGRLLVEGAVTGSGSGLINGGILDFQSSFSQDVAFTGGGELELAQSQGYKAAISGFSKTGGTSLDLRDITFENNAQATFSGNANSGVLTVTDGTHTAHITLKGDYTGTHFVTRSDGNGGVSVVDRPSPAAVRHQFVAAMASAGAGSAGALHTATQIHTQAMTLLAAPGARYA